MNVYDVAQDQRGYIWIASEQGICKFDGYNFTHIALDENSSSIEVISIFIDSHNRVWLNSAGPLRYIENDSVHLLDAISLNFDWHFNMLEDGFGNLWITNQKKMFCLESETLQIKQIPTGLLDESFRYKLLTNQDSKLYILCSSGIKVIKDMTCIDTLKYPVMPFYNNENKNRPIVHWPHLYYNDYEGLSRLNLQTQKTVNIDKDYRAIRIMKFHNNTLIASLESGGLYSYKFDENNEITIKRSFVKELDVGGYYFDNNNNLWIPTLMSGLYLFKPKSKFIRNYTKDTEVNSISVTYLRADKDKTLWIGSSEGILYKVKNESIIKRINTNTGLKRFNRIVAFEKLGADHYLIGTQDNLIEFKDDNQKCLIQHAIKSIHKKKNNVAISTYKNSYLINLNVLLQAGQHKPEYIASIADQLLHYKDIRSYSSFIDSDNEAWFSDKDNGLYKIMESDTFFYRTISPIFNRQCLKISELKTGEIIVNLKGIGIVLLKGKEFKIIDYTNKIINDFSINKNTLYIASNNGVDIIRFDSLDSRNYTIKKINNSVGLRTNRINSISVNDDFIYLGTRNGIMTVDKNIEEIVDKSAPEIPIFITSIIINGKSIPYDTLIHLKHEQNDIIFNYSGINYDSPNTIYYAYKLDGVDKTWLHTNLIEARYNNLAAGDYTFNVGILNESNSIPNSVKQVSFKIKDRFTDTIAFKLISLLMFSVFIALSVSSSIMKNQRNKLAQEVQLKTKELRHSVNELEVVNLELKNSNQTLKNYAHIASHDLKSPLRSISGFIQLFIIKNKDKLSGIDLSYLDSSIRHVKKMDQTIKDLLSFSSLNNQIRQEHIKINKLINEITSDLHDVITTKNVTIKMSGLETRIYSNLTGTKQIFQNLIENGIKYNRSENPLIEIKYSHDVQNHKFEISDNGIGIPSKYRESVFEMFIRLHNDAEFSGSGIGLAICKRILDKLGGSIHVQENYPQGSIFIFTIPKIEMNT